MDAVVEDTAETKSVRVTRRVAKPLDRVWDALMKQGGAEPLLGKGSAPPCFMRASQTLSSGLATLRVTLTLLVSAVSSTTASIV